MRNLKKHFILFSSPFRGVESKLHVCFVCRHFKVNCAKDSRPSLKILIQFNFFLDYYFIDVISIHFLAFILILYLLPYPFSLRLLGVFLLGTELHQFRKAFITFGLKEALLQISTLLIKILQNLNRGTT